MRERSRLRGCQHAVPSSCGSRPSGDRRPFHADCRDCTLLVYKIGRISRRSEGLMDFGLFAACHRFDESLSASTLYEQALEMVELADEAGFRIAWFPEHHLIHYISCPSPLMMAVKAASRTERIRLGTAILVIPYYNPLRLAGELGMADVLT